MIQMINTRNLAISVCWLVLWTPSIFAQDLSRYREFQLGMNLLAVAKQIDARPSEVKVIHQRPVVIQELEWRPRNALASSPEASSINEVLFSFYNGELFRMVVNYDPGKTLGLTNDDLVGAMSATYGTLENDHFFVGPRLQRN